MSDRISSCPNTCSPVPYHELFRVSLLEIALSNNATGVLSVLNAFKLRLREVSDSPYFQLEAYK